MEELIKTLQDELSKGAELVTYTVVIKKNYKAYTIESDDWHNVCVVEV